jgi:uncharacterized protein YbaR (Trm112 family)
MFQLNSRQLYGHVIKQDKDTGTTDLISNLLFCFYQVEVISGELVCPESGRRFSISKGIPNMLLNEDEL